MTRTACSLVVFALAGVSLGSASQLAGDKLSSWQPFIPPSPSKELIARSIQRLGELSSSDAKNVLGMMQAEAAILAGTAQSAKENDQAGNIQFNAILLATLAGPKGNADVAKQMAGGFKTAKVDGKPELKAVKWRDHLDDLNDVMFVFRTKGKGGEGLAADLQYTPKLKNLNGSEDLISALAAKKLTDANVEKVAKELPLLAYRIGVIGAITHDYGPIGKGKGEPKEWQKLSMTMRDSAIALAEAAEKKDSAAILSASKRLEGSCIECHRAFR